MKKPRQELQIASNMTGTAKDPKKQIHALACLHLGNGATHSGLGCLTSVKTIKSSQTCPQANPMQTVPHRDSFPRWFWIVSSWQLRGTITDNSSKTFELMWPIYFRHKINSVDGRCGFSREGTLRCLLWVHEIKRVPSKDVLRCGLCQVLGSINSLTAFKSEENRKGEKQSD